MHEGLDGTRVRQIDAVLVTELSRRGQSTKDLIKTLDELQDRGVSVLPLNGQSFDLNSSLTHQQTKPSQWTSQGAKRRVGVTNPRAEFAALTPAPSLLNGCPRVFMRSVKRKTGRHMSNGILGLGRTPRTACDPRSPQANSKS